jgi:hypothetical protein
MFEIIAFSLLFVVLCVSIFINVKLGLIILRIEDSIEECLDNLDERYQSVSKILEKPVFFDSIEVRQTIQEIRLSQESILKVANRLTRFKEPDDEKN